MKRSEDFAGFIMISNKRGSKTRITYCTPKDLCLRKHLGRELCIHFSNGMVKFKGTQINSIRKILEKAQKMENYYNV